MQRDVLVCGHCFRVGLRDPQREDGKAMYPPSSYHLLFAIGHPPHTLPGCTVWPLWHSPVLWGGHSTRVGTRGRTKRCGCTTGRGQAAEGCWPSDSESHSRDWVREQLRAWDHAERIWGSSGNGSLQSLQIWDISTSATKCQFTKARRSKSRLLTFLTLNSQVMLSLNILFK